jgi:hypothetical protein
MEGGNIIEFMRKNLSFPLHPDIIEYQRRKLGDFSEINKLWGIQNSKTTNEKLNKNPEDWYYYHELYRNKREIWDEIPYKEIAKKITRKDFIVADLGCGENLLKDEIPENKVLSFDYIAIDNSVTACDISKLPLENNCVDVVVFSLSLMGSNKKDYIIEGYRILKSFGIIMISEPLDKWKDKENTLKEIIEEIGFSNVEIKKTNSFLYLTAIKQ